MPSSLASPQARPPPPKDIKVNGCVLIACVNDVSTPLVIHTNQREHAIVEARLAATIFYLDRIN